MMNRRRMTRPALGVLVLVALDLWVKWWAVGALDDGPIDVPGPVDLRLGYNTGTAFGLLADLPVAVTSIGVGAVLLMVAVAWLRRRLPTVPTTLIVAGGVANLVDRLWGNGVVDMIHTGWWPTFNIADVYITTGVALLIVHHLLSGRRKGEAALAHAPAGAGTDIRNLPEQSEGQPQARRA